MRKTFLRIPRGTPRRNWLAFYKSWDGKENEPYLKGIITMKYRRKLIEVRTLPGQIDGARLRTLYRELESCINVDGPAVVLDCSMLNQIDKPAIHFLLCCLEEAMKRNGDIRLAAPQPELKAEIESTGLDTLFQVFDSIEDALESFRMPRMNFILPEQSAGNDRRASENAA
jgi:anti-anti-sigma factor